jgi:hypothetical protein
MGEARLRTLLKVESLNYADATFELRCRELLHDFRRVPTGKVVLRQREADRLADNAAKPSGRSSDDEATARNGRASRPG